MTEVFEFELVYALPAGEHDIFDLSDAVYTAGYDDAIVGTGDPRLLAVELEVEADDAESAILTAAKRIIQNLPNGTQLREVRPDLVSLADVAERLEVKRQALQQRPMPPAVGGGLYRIAEIAEMLSKFEQPAEGGRRARMNFKRANGWLLAGKVATAINAKMALKKFDSSSLEDRESS